MLNKAIVVKDIRWGWPMTFILWFALFPQFAIAQDALSGHITAGDNNEPLPGVNVFIPELSLGTTSTKSGSYRIDHLPEGNYLVQYSYVGFQTQHRRIRMDGREVSIDIVMDPHIIESEEVVISGNFTTTQHENTIKISTMGISEINRTTDPSLMASVGTVPGVNLISKGPGVVTPVIRGLSLNNILVLKNGVPLQNYQFSEDHPYLVSDEGLSRVEVIKGPASLIYGSGAVGGVINLIPEPVAQDGTISGKYDLRYFSNTVGMLSNLSLKGNQHGIVWGIGGGVNSHKDYIQGDGNFAPNTRFNSYNVNADVGIIRKRGIFRLFYSRNASHFGMAVAPALALVTENGRRNEFWYQDLKDDLISSRNRFYVGDIKLDLDLSYQHNHRQLKGDEPGEHFTLVDMTLQTITFAGKVTHQINEHAEYIVGVQGMFQENKNNGAPDRVLPDASGMEISTYGLFQYNVSLFKFEAGLRYNYANIFVPYQEATGGHGHGDDEEEHEDEEEMAYISYDGRFDNLSASLGATAQVSESSLFRMNIASAFRNPNLAELTQQGRHGLRYEEGNAGLQMQQNIEFDLGYHLHTKHTSFDVALFYNYIFNYIHLAPSADTTEDGDRIYRYTQAEASLYGGETTIHIHPHPLDWFHFKASYSLIFGKYREGGYLPRIPANNLNIEIRLTAESWKGLRDLYLEGGVNFVFAQNNPSQFELSTSGYNLVSLGAGFDVQLKHNRININLRVSNLLDIDYYDHLSTLRDLNIYNMGRNVMLGVRIPFRIKN